MSLWFSITPSKETKKHHDDVIKWKHFPHYWSFMWGIHRSQENSPHKGQWRRAFMFSLICTWTNGSANNRDAGGLKRHSAHWRHCNAIGTLLSMIRLKSDWNTDLAVDDFTEPNNQILLYILFYQTLSTSRLMLTRINIHVYRTPLPVV